MPRKKKHSEFIFAVGRRKTSVARARLYKGREQSLVNDIPIEDYFSGMAAARSWDRPFQLTQTLGKYYASIKVQGGGKHSQLGAVIHGISRALAQGDGENFRGILKKHGLLTRDPRARERRKVGTGGKARRKKQSPKR